MRKMNNRILIVEDNASYRKLLAEILENEGYIVDVTDNSLKALELLAMNDFSLLITDLYLDGINGIQLAGTAKNIIPSIRTVILTGNPQEATEMEAIESEIDLYLSKDKNLIIILKYIENLISSATVNGRSTVLESKSEKIAMDLKKFEVTKNGEEIELTPIEFLLLQLFLENKNQRLDRSVIIEHIWGDEEIVPRVVDVHVKNLRDKLRVLSITTIRGYGYKWNER